MPISSEACAALRLAFGERVLFEEPLSRHSSARIGGPAEAFLAARSVHDLAEAAQIAWEYDVPLFILGGGSNILISDAGIRGLVVHNRAEGLHFDGTQVLAESGVSTISVARRSVKRGLAGFEWAAGIPGTIGGAVFGNAGAHGGDMAGVVVYADVITPEGERRLSNADLAFEYRSSILKREPQRAVVLRVLLQLEAGDPDVLTSHLEEFRDYRRRTQPPGATIGSMFKNPPGDYAGRLIDAAGLKGTRIGGAEISTKHGNFFLNVGDANASDVRALAELARREVREQFGVELELEIELVGEW